METRFISVEPIAPAVPVPAPQAAPIVPAPIPSAPTGGAFQRLSAAPPLEVGAQGHPLKGDAKLGPGHRQTKAALRSCPELIPFMWQEQPPQQILCRSLLESAQTSSL
jgi:hypothetical protein